MQKSPSGGPRRDTNTTILWSGSSIRGWLGERELERSSEGNSQKIFASTTRTAIAQDIVFRQLIASLYRLYVAVRFSEVKSESIQANFSARVNAASE
jgi:hypothetical protein